MAPGPEIPCFMDKNRRQMLDRGPLTLHSTVESDGSREHVFGTRPRRGAIANHCNGMRRRKLTIEMNWQASSWTRRLPHVAARTAGWHGRRSEFDGAVDLRERSVRYEGKKTHENTTVLFMYPRFRHCKFCRRDRIDGSDWTG